MFPAPERGAEVGVTAKSYLVELYTLDSPFPGEYASWRNRWIQHVRIDRFPVTSCTLTRLR